MANENADFVRGWRACAAWMGRMIRNTQWDPATRKRLKALVSLADDATPSDIRHRAAIKKAEEG